MNSIAKRALALALLASFALAIAPAYSADPPIVRDGASESIGRKALMKMCDESPDGTVTKAQVMKEVERMFDKKDPAKTGKMTKTQLQLFFEEYNRFPGG